MALVKFISGDGVEHRVEDSSYAAEIMRQNGFQEIGADLAEITYTEADAVAQNDGEDVSTKAPVKKAVAKKKTA